jgi:hypothetical protein
LSSSTSMHILAEYSIFCTALGSMLSRVSVPRYREGVLWLDRVM